MSDATGDEMGKYLAESPHYENITEALDDARYLRSTNEGWAFDGEAAEHIEQAIDHLKTVERMYRANAALQAIENTSDQ